MYQIRPLSLSFFHMVTVVPFPTLEVTFRASVKLSMTVNPMPLRSPAASVV